MTELVLPETEAGMDAAWSRSGAASSSEWQVQVGGALATVGAARARKAASGARVPGPGQARKDGAPGARPGPGPGRGHVSLQPQSQAA